MNKIKFTALALFVGAYLMIVGCPGMSLLSSKYPTVYGGPYASELNSLYFKLQELELDEGNCIGASDCIQTHSEIYKTKNEIEVLQKKRKEAIKKIDTSACFTADMFVITPNGSKPIAMVQIGDKVLSVNDEGIQVEADVLKTLASTNHHYFLINNQIKVTAMHRFFTKKGWKTAQDLYIGDLIQTTANVFEKIDTIKFFEADLDVYNLTISKNHNFFISPNGKTGFLVHNSAGGHEKEDDPITK